MIKSVNVAEKLVVLQYGLNSLNLPPMAMASILNTSFLSIGLSRSLFGFFFRFIVDITSDKFFSSRFKILIKFVKAGPEIRQLII